LVEGSQGQVWQLGIFDGQLLCGHNVGTFAIEGGQARKISDITGGWCTVAVPDRPDLLLQSTYTGLVVFQKNKSGKWAFSHRAEGFSQPLRRIAFDAEGNLWGAHPNQGLYALRLSDDWQKCLESRLFTQKDGLPTDVHIDLTNIDGQIFLNTETWPLKPLRQPGGAWRFEAVAHSGGEHFKWLKGMSGDLFRLDSSGISLQSAGKAYKMAIQLVPRFEQVEALPDSSYLFCLENGYARLERSQLACWKAQASPAAPVIRYVRAAGGPPLTPAEGMEFRFAQNSLRFVFGQAVFERQPKYAWFLEGFSKNWSEWQAVSEKEFTNLPEGRYTFRLKSDAGDGEASLSFKIWPPWYRSAWAYLAYALAIGLALWRFEQFNRRRLERQRQRHQAEKEREILLLEVANKSRELSNAAFNLIRKNEALQSLRDELLAAAPEAKSLQKIIRHIDAHLEGDHDWELFEESFNRVHDDFFKRLMQQYPELTPSDLRLAAYLKMNLSSKEIAPLLNISVRGIENKRYRLRKKLGLSEEDNLTEFIMNF
jgi:DNA-binding CsgD family transcriptional regulator